MLNASTFTSLGREHREWIATLNPVMPIGNAVKLGIRSSRNQNIVVEPIGTDAKIASNTTGARKPKLTIVIAGETARAESFSLGGYKKNTNPELAAQICVKSPMVRLAERCWISWMLKELSVLPIGITASK